LLLGFSTQKDHETLFDALSLLNDEQKDLLIINLIGGGELIDKFIDKSISMKISRSLNFVGETSNVNKYLFNSDLFMLISNYEGLPVSIIEALSVGIPIIASDVGGVNELVKEGVNGFLIPKKDSITLYKVLVNLVSDNNCDIESMGRKSRENL
jgi:glycosyltransferase involved in cell wall biosynthesis